MHSNLLAMEFPEGGGITDVLLWLLVEAEQVHLAGLLEGSDLFQCWTGACFYVYAKAYQNEIFHRVVPSDRNRWHVQVTSF